MKCCLPNKLIILRKHFNYSQQEIAKKLNVSINEYMAFENGNAMCSMEQIKQLADIFHISVDEMFVNSVDIELPVIEPTLDIPFVTKEEEIEQASEDLGMTKRFDTISDTPASEDLGKTIVMPAVKNIEDLNDDRIDNTTVTKVVKDDNSDKKPSKNKPLFISAIAIIVVIAMIAVAIFAIKTSEGSVNNKLTDINRLVTTNSYSAYLDNSQRVSAMPSTISINEIVQITATNDDLIGLKADGTLVSANDKYDFSKFKDIVMIAGGYDHVLGLDNEGKVLCAGNSTSCAIDEVNDVKKVYAGKDASVLIDSNGKVYAYGNAAYIGNINGLVSVNKLSLADDVAVVLMKDGTVNVYGQGVYDTSDYKGIIDVACGDDFILGLKNDGTLIISNDDMKKTADKFSDIKYISAYHDYYVACNANGVCHGDGVNNGQFTMIDNSEKLDSVKNFNYSITAKKVNMTWDSIEMADHYELTFNTSDSYTVKSATNSLSVDASKFEDGNTYEVRIIAFGKDGYDNSDEAVYTLNYVANLSALDSISNFKVTVGDSDVTFSFDSVENAKSYEFKIKEIDYSKSTSDNHIVIPVTSFTENNSYTISIIAKGNDNYSDSQEFVTTYTYQSNKVKLSTPNSISATYDGTYVKFSWDKVENAVSYTITIDNGVNQLTSETSVLIPVDKFSKDNQYNVAVVANGEGKYTTSDARNYVYTYNQCNANEVGYPDCYVPKPKPEGCTNWDDRNGVCNDVEPTAEATE